MVVAVGGFQELQHMAVGFINFIGVGNQRLSSDFDCCVVAHGVIVKGIGHLIVITFDRFNPVIFIGVAIGYSLTISRFRLKYSIMATFDKN